jgi:ADP-ribose pyrophosphatase YjhB (NUDIX family)
LDERRFFVYVLDGIAPIRTFGAQEMLRKVASSALAGLIPILYHIRLAGWFIRRPFMIGVRALVIDGDTLLLVRGHGQQSWHLPGGAVKRQEGLVEAVKREVFEETGCRIEVERLLGMYANFSEWKSDHVGIFVGHPLSAPTPTFNIEIAEARFFPLTSLPKPLHDSVRARLADYHAERWGMTGPWKTDEAV